ncbi:MAG: DegT/DnrJ/EryC1/StrS family aminotransferase [Anaeroplasmataceae bacterium]|nr:DegT/DnrJ/EryC1/StrS family aminotransferase [Anaeroplasmataceae bacterium]
MEKILVTRSSMPEFNEYVDEIRDIWDTHWLTNMGEKHNRLQKLLKEYMSVDNIELLTNGHMALELTMQALSLKGEVITTPFTFASTTHAIVRNGLTPVFCDINPMDFTIDVSKIERLITKRTSAIVPVHVYGNICDVEEIERISRKYGLKVIYDAAHTFGVTYQGKGIGVFGDASCFSFHATKVFNTIEGGAVCYKDKELGDKIYDLKNFGIRGEEHVKGIGANAKMNEFQAAMGICNLRHIDEELQKRRKVVEHYRERLEGVKGIQLNPIQRAVRPNYAYFPVVINAKEFGANRNEIFEQLKAHNIHARKYFYPLTSAFECYNECFNVSLTPIAMEISKSVLTLPLYADLHTESIDNICNLILSMQK